MTEIDISPEAVAELTSRLQKLCRDMDRHAAPDWDEHEDVFAAVNVIGALSAALAKARAERDTFRHRLHATHRRAQRFRRQTMSDLIRRVDALAAATRFDGCAHSNIGARIAALSAASPEPVAAHPDDMAVDRFATAMKAKLAAAREKGRGGWDDPAQCSIASLAKLLVGHIGKGNVGNFEDIANLAMMLHQRGADPAVVGAAITSRPEAEARAEAAAHLTNCVICGRIVDTREVSDGGDLHGCKYDAGWVCSSDCGCKLLGEPTDAEERSAEAWAAAVEAAAVLCDETARDTLEASGEYSWQVSDWFRAQARQIRALTTPADIAPLLAARDARLRLEVQHALDTADAAIAWQRAAEAERDGAVAILAATMAERDALLHDLERIKARETDLTSQVEALREECRGYLAVWAAQYARQIGLSGMELHHQHYDRLSELGARMDDFVRAAWDGK